MAYPWPERLGHCTDDFFREPCCSALMVLWLDAVSQLVRANPSEFEFTEALLSTIGRHLYSCRFGNFLGSTEEVRTKLGFEQNTMSLWSFLNTQRTHFLNASQKPGMRYQADATSLKSLPVPREVVYWHEFHHDVNDLADLGTLAKVGGGCCTCY